MISKQFLTLLTLGILLVCNYRTYSQDNTPPQVIQQIANQTINEDQNFRFALKLNEVFSDENAMTFAVNKQQANWLTNVGDSLLIGFPLAEHAGNYTIKVTAIDIAGNSASTSFSIIVTEVDDKPIVVNNLPSQLQRPGFGQFKVYYKNVFYDEEDKSLAYDVRSSYPAVASAQLIGDSILVKERGIGPAEIVLTATDSHGNSTETKMFIRIFEEAEILNMTTANTGSNGMANSMVTCVRRDYSGNIWVATQGEINRYNDGRWEQFPLAKSANGYIKEIWDDNKGNVYFISFGRFIKYDGVDFQYHNLREDPDMPDCINASYISKDSVLYLAGDSFNDDYFIDVNFSIIRSTESGWSTVFSEDTVRDSCRVHKMCVDNANNVWIITQRGLEMVKDGSRKLIVEVEHTENYVRGLDCDIYGNIWYAYSSGVYCLDYKQNTLKKYEVEEIETLYADDLGNIWIGQKFGHITKIKDGVKRQYTLDGPIAKELMLGGNNYLASISKTSDGRYWFGTAYGLFVAENYQLKDESLIIQHTFDGLVANRVDNILRDSEGNYFVNTGYGVSKYDGLKWEYEGRRIKVMCVDRDDNKICKYYNADIAIIDKNGKRTYYWQDHTHCSHVEDIIVDGNNNIWISGMGCLAMFDRTKWTYYTTNEGLLSNAPKLLFADSKGNIWIEYSEKYEAPLKHTISIFDGSSFKHHTFEEDGDYTTWVNDITEDKDGNIWIAGGNQGLLKYNGSEWTRYTLKDGLKSRSIRSLAIDREQGVWLAYSFCDDCPGIGVSRFDGTKFDHFTTEDGLPSNRVKKVYVDHALTNQNKSGSMNQSETTDLIWLSTQGEGAANFYLQNATSVVDYDLPEMKAMIFPNPTQGITNVVLDSNNRKYVDIEVLNIDGKQVYRDRTEDIFGKIQLNLSSNTPGVYLVKLKSDVDSVVKKIILK